MSHQRMPAFSPIQQEIYVTRSDGTKLGRTAPICLEPTKNAPTTSAGPAGVVTRTPVCAINGSAPAKDATAGRARRAMMTGKAADGKRRGRRMGWKVPSGCLPQNDGPVHTLAFGHGHRASGGLSRRGKAVRRAAPWRQAGKASSGRRGAEQRQCFVPEAAIRLKVANVDREDARLGVSFGEGGQRGVRRIPGGYFKRSSRERWRRAGQGACGTRAPPRTSESSP